MEQIKAFFDYVINNWQMIYNPTFQKGCIAGAIILFLVFIMIKIIGYIFKKRQHKCNGVIGRDETGEIFVSSVAISDLVKSMEPQFTGLYIAKTLLFKEKRSYLIKLIAELDDKEANFPNLVDNIRGQILLAVKDNLGIDSIKKIDIHLRRVKTK